MSTDYIPPDILARLQRRHISAEFFNVFAEKTHTLSETLKEAIRKDEENNKERQQLLELIEKERQIYDKREVDKQHLKLVPDVLTPEEITAYDDIIHAMTHVKILLRTQAPSK